MTKYCDSNGAEGVIGSDIRHRQNSILSGENSIISGDLPQKYTVLEVDYPKNRSRIKIRGSAPLDFFYIIGTSCTDLRANF